MDSNHTRAVLRTRRVDKFTPGIPVTVVVTLAALSLPLQLPHHVLLLSAAPLRPAPAPPRPLPLHVPLPEPVLIAPPLPLPTLAVLVLVLSLSLPILPIAVLVLSLSLPIPPVAVLPAVAALLLLLPLLVIPVLLPVLAAAAVAVPVAVLPRAGPLRGALLVALAAAGGALLVAGTVGRSCGGLHRLLQVLVLVEVHGGRRVDRGSGAENLDGVVGERRKLNPKLAIGWLAFRIEKDWVVLDRVLSLYWKCRAHVQYNTYFL
jgi:hypothetical protein